MCGIAGCLTSSLEGDSIGRDVAAMTRALAHRGPDDEGLLFWRRGAPPVAAATDQTVPSLRDRLPDARSAQGDRWHIAMGHRRFSIVDISPAGHQPFMDPEGRAAVIFNGEIYNYVELRAEMEKAGRLFRTQSDTEVLLQAYLHWGEDMLPRLNGMWAFALLDFRTGRLLLARDRVGKKSLFYTTVGNRFFFASEITALFSVPEIWARRKTNDELVQDYLYLGLRDHTHSSLYEGIVNLPAASFAWLDKSFTLTPQTYWRLPETRLTEQDIGYDEARQRLLDLLDDSVNIRLRADVPLAAELSGGMDSTTLVALAARRLRQSNSPHPLRTFTIRYDDPAFDESSYAQKVAQQAGVEFNPLLLRSEDYWSSAENMIQTMQQPYESPNLMGCLWMWRLMKKDGIHVVLNGGGGDELLAGYIHAHLLPYLRELLTTGRWSDALREAGHWIKTDYLHPVKLRRYLLHQLPALFRGFYMRRAFKRPEFSALRPPADGLRRFVRESDSVNRCGLGAILRRNIERAPIPMYVVQSDKLAMSLPIEVRYPYLDYRLLDFAFQLPLTYLIRHGKSKAVLRDAARGLIPDAVINRREKMGFPVPLRQWMHEGTARFLAQFSGDPRSGRFINTTAVRDQSAPLSEAMRWRVSQVELWMKTFDLT